MATEDLVPRPDRLAETPAERRQTEQQPRSPHTASVPERRVTAACRRQQGGRGLADVVDGDRRGVSAPTVGDACDEEGRNECGERGRGGKGRPALDPEPGDGNGRSPCQGQRAALLHGTRVGPRTRGRAVNTKNRHGSLSDVEFDLTCAGGYL